MPSLRELQLSFAAGLRGGLRHVGDWVASDGIPAAARLRLYRHSSRALFDRVLERTFPVVRRRIGSDHFRRLAHFYRREHPSSVGDLHEIGRHFPAFLASHLAAGPYAWLAQLATLEWAVADAAVAADSGTATAASVIELAPEVLESVRLQLVPSLRRVETTASALAAWQASQAGTRASATDVAGGDECVIVHRASSGVQLRRVERAEFEFITALGLGQTLAGAFQASALSPERLPGLLFWLFADEAVAAVLVPTDG